MSEYKFKSEDIARGAPGYVAPLSVAFSPDGKRLTYLFPDEGGPRRVFAVDLDQNDASKSYKLFDTNSSEGLSLQEQLRRERMRLFTSGIATYEWSNKETSPEAKLLVPLDGKVLLYQEGNVRVVYDGSIGDAIDPHLAPNGSAVAFVINDDLYAVQVPRNDATEAAVPTRLTFNGAKPGVTCGLADYVAQEEMDRYRGFWWSPDSARIVYAEADETMVPEFEIAHLGKADPTHTETHRYPFAGKVNPQVTLFVVEVKYGLTGTEAEDAAKQHVSLDLVDVKHPDFTTVAALNPGAKGAEEGKMDFYIARVDWWADGSVMAQIENRKQSVLQLLRLDPITGERTVVLEERSDVWINLYHMLHTFTPAWRLPGDSAGKDDFYFLWASEHTGFAQLYLYCYDAAARTGVKVAGPIGGGGEFVVESIDAVDEAANRVYFSGNRGNAGERHLYAASLLPEQTGTLVQLTSEAGFHTATVNPEKGYVADCFSSVTTPLTMRLYALDTVDTTQSLRLIGTVTDSAVTDTRLTAQRLRESLVTPVFHTIRSTDDKVDLHCAVYLPKGVTFDPSSDVQATVPAAAIMSVYGGPHVQRVQNHWALTADLRAQCLAQQGFVVIKCDNRGAFRRGIAFEGAIHRDMGNLEVQDQNAAVAYFAKRGLIDPTRVGMFGWSYGGYMSAMSVCRSPAGTYACAVAGAPVTSWDGYDTHYTERYMGTPQDNPEGYAASSVMTHVPTMSGKLMLVHGLIDENVHFRHTARLINTLISARKRYELVLFPCERHSPHKLDDKIYIEDIMQAFLADNLRPALPVARDNQQEVTGVSIPAAAAVAVAAVAAGTVPKILSAL